MHTRASCHGGILDAKRFFDLPLAPLPPRRPEASMRSHVLLLCPGGGRGMGAGSDKGGGGGGQGDEMGGGEGSEGVAATTGV